MNAIAGPGDALATVREHQAASRWLEANEATRASLQRSMSNARPVSAEALHLLDGLWTRASGGHFGFNAQLDVWRGLGDGSGDGTGITTLTARVIERFERFGDRVGWRIGGRWTLLTPPARGEPFHGFPALPQPVTLQTVPPGRLPFHDVLATQDSISGFSPRDAWGDVLWMRWLRLFAPLSTLWLTARPVQVAGVPVDGEGTMVSQQPGPMPMGTPRPGGGRRPGGELATRPLHFVWIADCSGSMAEDGKIQTLNVAIREAIPHMQQVADENPNADVLVRAIKFSSGAQWHISQPTPVKDFKWDDLSANGVTDMGRALSMVADQLKIPPMTDRALPPVLVLLSDGQPTDNFDKGLKALLDEPWGKKAVRMAVAIGTDADLEVLQKFIAHSELKPLQANNPEALVAHIRWVSTAVLKSASSPASQTNGTSPGAVNVPIPQPPGAPTSAADVW